MLLMSTLGANHTAMIEVSSGDRYSRILRKIFNNKFEFMVPDTINPSTTIDGFYLYLITPYSRKVAKKYGGTVIPELVTILQKDASRDLAADAMLYAIVKRGASRWHRYISMEKPFDIQKWRLEMKHADIAFWIDFLQKTSLEELSKLRYLD